MHDTVITTAVDVNNNRYIIGPSKVVGEDQLYYNMFSIDGGRMLMHSCNVVDVRPATASEVIDAISNNSDPLLQRHLDRIYDNVIAMENVA